MNWEEKIFWGLMRECDMLVWDFLGVRGGRVNVIIYMLEFRCNNILVVWIK